MLSVLLRRFALSLLVLAAGMPLQSCSRPAAEHVRITTGSTDGTYYPIGAQLSWLLDHGDYPAVKSSTAQVSDGSLQNLERLKQGRADIALVGETKLRADTEALEKVHALSILYASVFHILATDSLENINSLRDLAQRGCDQPPLRIFMDAPGSGARRTAMKVFQHLQIPACSYTPDQLSATYRSAAERLLNGEIDLAIIHEAMPSEEVEFATGGGARLLKLGEDIPDELEGEVGLEVTIPKYLYPNQEFPIATVADRAFLVARADLGTEVVVAVLDALFENARELARAHPIATNIRTSGLEHLPKEISQHRGVEVFKERDRSKLLIATGPANGAYYETGKIIQRLLKDRGVASFVSQTDGSLDNLTKLSSEERPVLAIVQYDIGLASHSYDPKAVYKINPPEISDLEGSLGGTERWEIPNVKDMRRIATLHDEPMYIFARNGDGSGAAPESYLSKHAGLRVCFGAENSGTQILARAIFGESRPKLERAVYLPPDQMIRQLENNHLDIGFAIIDRRSAVVARLLANDDITLLPIKPETIERLRGPAIQPHRVSPDYGRQADEQESISTVKTNAVLVVNRWVSDGVVATIAEAVIRGRDLLLEREELGDEEALKRLVTGSSGIRLHPAAEAYYKEHDYIAGPDGVDWLQVTWRLVAISLGIVSLGSVVIGFRGRLAAERFERKVIRVELAADAAGSVKELIGIQAVLKKALNQRRWSGQALTTAKWRSIDELVERRIARSRDLLTRSLVRDIRRFEQLHQEDQPKLEEEYLKIKERIVRFFEARELDAVQYAFLLEMIPSELRAPGHAHGSTPEEGPLDVTE